MFYIDYIIETTYVPEIFRRVHGILSSDTMNPTDRVAVDFVNVRKDSLTLRFVHPSVDKLTSFMDTFHSGSFGVKMGILGINRPPDSGISEYTGDTYRVNFRVRKRSTRRKYKDVYMVGDVPSLSNRSHYGYHISSSQATEDVQWMPNGYGLSSLDGNHHCNIPSG